MRGWWQAMVIAGLVACGGGADGGDAATGHGVVLGVDHEAARITIDHGEIPGTMKAMTMTFDVSNANELAGIEKGDEIVFELVYADGTYTVTSVSEE